MPSERHNHTSNNNNNNINNNNNSLTNNNQHSFERGRSESPDLNTEQRCSPVESSRSYPTSQKSDEGGYHSPIHPDSVGSRSPENLSSLAKKSNEMLDHHKLPLSFLGPPLAALHSMTEMKSANITGGGNGGQNGNNSNNIGLQQTQSQIGAHGAANPHGIDTILSRPPPVTTAGLNALTSGKFIISIFSFKFRMQCFYIN